MYQKNYSNRYRNTSRRPNRFGFKRRGSSGGSRNSSIDISKYINRNPEETLELAFIPSVNINDLAVDEKLKYNIQRKGYTQLTPIQDKAIPLIMNGRDLIGIANTGTGKTAAFLIPLINKVYLNKQEKVLIIAPTRELAQQINAEFRSLSQGLNIYSTLCIGGTNMYSQRRDLGRPHNFLICTPGRIKDVAERKWINLSMYNNIVVDEVDRMFDMGFQKDIRIILGQLPTARQTLFFSATVSDNIEALIKSFLNTPEKVSINQKISSVNIMQDIIRTDSAHKKIDVLHDILIKPEYTKVLIFIKTKWSLNEVEKELIDRGFKVASIHGNKTQGARQRSLSIFKENRTQILLATDIAARGLDINNVSHVINYDQPATYNDYIHRIGRTGRGNNKGVALTFI
ncbi:hypothetical protein A2982_02895 [candidate division WWE3 bacterium RIFCSPLOWO2_01_FULL_39_13]|uniref:RNA helicase n=1 Tax=candidate division WWE3 bacterium RIFCSPLOWO2_01_FULL_39_13 TaxID=1802624 RepID=A0A1F4V2Z9_UNCKA|nr:MAG: hypothetical protein A2982_02895 [candidate division WWE3 bacterium RIFCSPLOWO2_01_FULL_39_13]